MGREMSLADKIMVDADSLQKELSVCQNRYYVAKYTRSASYTMVMFVASLKLCQSTIANYAGSSKTTKRSYKSSRTQ